jgi:hypothetical protein
VLLCSDGNLVATLMSREFLGLIGLTAALHRITPRSAHCYGGGLNCVPLFSALPPQIV